MRRLLPWLIFLTIGVVGVLTRSGSTAPVAIAAAHFTVTIDGTSSVTQDSSLYVLREIQIVGLREKLPAAWSAATRGLGSLTVSEAKPDIPIHVVAASGTSVHRSGTRTAGQEILIYVAEDGRRMTIDETVSTALHELGHIWCCSGTAADTGGHWAAAVDDGRQFGINRYGLMNSPVNCNIQPNKALLCPNRFSDRELATMGFSAPPAATADPCVAALDRLAARIKLADAQLASASYDLDVIRASRKRAESTLSFYDIYAYTGIPSHMYGQYLSEKASYDSLVARERTAVANYNDVVDSRNRLSHQRDLDAPRCVID